MLIYINRILEYNTVIIKFIIEYTDVCVYSHVTFVLMISFGILLIQVHKLINMFQSFMIPFNNGFMQ